MTRRRQMEIQRAQHKMLVVVSRRRRRQESNSKEQAITFFSPTFFSRSPARSVTTFFHCTSTRVCVLLRSHCQSAIATATAKVRNSSVIHTQRKSRLLPTSRWPRATSAKHFYWLAAIAFTQAFRKWKNFTVSTSNFFSLFLFEILHEESNCVMRTNQTHAHTLSHESDSARAPCLSVRGSVRTLVRDFGPVN